MNRKLHNIVQLSQADHARIFFQSSMKGDNNGWYISLTSERAYGPFPDRDVAEYILDGILKRAAARREREHADHIQVNAA